MTIFLPSPDLSHPGSSPTLAPESLDYDLWTSRVGKGGLLTEDLDVYGRTGLPQTTRQRSHFVGLQTRVSVDTPTLHPGSDPSYDVVG